MNTENRFKVKPKIFTYFIVVKEFFRYLKGQPKLGLWYPRDSPFDLEAFSDSDYAGASLDRKSTTGGCQFLGRRLISWQCKKQTIVANSTTEAEYVAAANCYGQVLWIQNQMLDYGFNFMNTKIYIDNESTICIVKNLVFHSKTKHIEIRHHFIRDSYEKKLIQVIKIHTDHNVADLLTKAFDVSSGPIHLVADETVYKEWEDIMERVATTASSLEAEHDSGSGLRCQDTILGVQKLKLERELVRITIDDENAFWKEIGVNAVYADRHTLPTVRHKLMLPGIIYYCWKPEGSAGFHQIVDFFNSTYIKYALTKNPIIYVSLIHQFWETASSSTSENGEMETTATIDGESSFDCDFVSLDPIINSRKYTIKNSFTLGSTEEADKVTILQSCNGLLLCTGSRRHAFNYVYNPSTNLLKILSEPDYVNVDSNVYGCAGLRLAFDPTKSPYYKVVRAKRTCSDIFIQIYCSEKGNWSLCNERFNYFFLHFDSTIYWNNALHWLETENSQLTHYKLNFEYPDHPIIKIIQIPQSLQQRRNFFKSYGNILPMIITIQIPHILHLEGKLFDSRGFLLLVRRDDFVSSKFTIYEMMKGSSVWSVRYHVDTDDFMTPLPEGWLIRPTVWSIVLVEMEDDSFLVINLSRKVVEYNNNNSQETWEKV
ncbi:hypothetical protein Tco_1031121 [Tanacetum coccineum]|uniref:F-box associated beta-propeller type 1 domain-containing protein n=1 Tax=Tanacetum coccineum TaxID=301880 RepID=A0ABQ5G9K1_9ASTR